MSIVTFSLNPTIDMSSEAELVRPTHKIRTANESYDPGGGGVNVARVVHELGGQARVICPAGGFTGLLLDQMLGAMGIERTIVPIAGLTRIGVTVFERSSGHEFRFIPGGPQLSPAELDACLAAVRDATFDYFIASGSIANGAPPDILARVGKIVAEKGAKFILDSSGPGLGITLDQGSVYLVKPSFGELEALAGRRLDDESARDAALDIIERGHAEIVTVTMGAAGALAVSKDTVLRMWSPKIRSRSAVGAGDSFLAAMTLALSQGRALEDALIFAIAAGAATVLTAGTQLCHKNDVGRIYDDLCRARSGDAVAI